MGTFLHLFKTEAEYNDALNNGAYSEPWVSYTKDIERVDYNLPEYERLLKTPLTFEIIDTEDGDYIRINSEHQDRILFKQNDEDWYEPSDPGTGHYEIMVEPGDVVQIKGDYDGSPLTFENTPCKFNVFGNIMSVYDSTNFADITEIEDDTFTLSNFFSSSNAVSAEKLIIPLDKFSATGFCYDMFKTCTSLTTAPELPTMGLTKNCYEYMFFECASLTKAPSILPATILSGGEYASMFEGCISLTKSPLIPDFTWLKVSTLDSEAPFKRTFNGCSNLTEVTCLETQPDSLTNTLAFGGWLTGVGSTGTFYKAPGASWVDSVGRKIGGVPPEGWYIVDYED